MTFADFQSIYDFTLIERGVQQFFISATNGAFVAPPDNTSTTREDWTPPQGAIPFYTAFQSLTFQKCRPRVYIAALQFNSFRDAYAIDANGAIREKAWGGTMRLGIDTDPDYAAHTTLRAQVLAIIPQGVVISSDGSAFSTGGINSFLNFHQVSQFWTKDLSTSMSVEEGYYTSQIPLVISFSVLPTVWPAGMQTV